MLHPLIKKKVSSRGVHIELNSIVGYDSEYELLSSSDKTNTLLSIQLAGNSYMNVKIPVTGKVFDIKDLNIRGSQTPGEKTYILIFKSSIDSMIKEIREVLFKENDLKIADLDILLEEKLKNKEIKGMIYLPADDCRIYSFRKSEVATLIKIQNTYYFKDLIKDAELLNEKDHKLCLTEIMTSLNDVCGNKTVLSQKMLDCIDNSVSRPNSRINLKYNSSMNNLSISVIKNLYLCMHESGADLSMLTDFEIMKEQFEVISKSFVTIGKPLKIKDSNDCLIGNSRLYMRDTILLAPQGAKSLADIGKIYGPNYHKIDIGEYRNGKMSALLAEDRDKFIKYGIRDAVITLKHATMMQEFYFSVGKTSVPVTLSGISKAYVIKE